jgi:hypothetical protein
MFPSSSLVASPADTNANAVSCDIQEFNGTTTILLCLNRSTDDSASRALLSVRDSPHFVVNNYLTQPKDVCDVLKNLYTCYQFRMQCVELYISVVS